MTSCYMYMDKVALKVLCDIIICVLPNFSFSKDVFYRYTERLYDILDFHSHENEIQSSFFMNIHFE